MATGTKTDPFTVADCDAAPQWLDKKWKWCRCSDCAAVKQCVPDEGFCYECNGNGFKIICPDDMCHGLGFCMHGDGEMTCPACDGRGH